MLSAVHAEPSVLPFTGRYTVDLRHAGDKGVRYMGRVTLEASPEASASFEEGH